MIVNYHNPNNIYCRNVEDDIVTLVHEIEDLQTLLEDTRKLQRHVKIINILEIACIVGALFMVVTLFDDRSNKPNFLLLATAITFLFERLVEARFRYEAARPLRRKYAIIYPEFNLEIGVIPIRMVSIINSLIGKSRQKATYLLNDFSTRHKDLFKLKFAMQTELGQMLLEETWNIISNYSSAVTASYKVKFAQKTDLGETLPPEVWKRIGDYGIALTKC